jgi:P-type E1-E2 ATPase
MIELNIPGRPQVTIRHAVLDFNGTFAEDGILMDHVKDALMELSKLVKLHVVSGDTNGTVKTQCAELPVTISVLQPDNQTEQKRRYVAALLSEGVVAVGNGANDSGMFAEADLAIAVLGPEGLAAAALREADVIVKDPVDGFRLLLKSNRITGTLRQ